jgi:glycerol-3-phosphate dehydrogenase
MRREPELAQPLTGVLPYVSAEVAWAVRYEMARTVEDVLCRRTRSLFFNAKAAIEAAPKVASLMAHEFEYDSNWESKQLVAFQRVAMHFSLDKKLVSWGADKP